MAYNGRRGPNVSEYLANLNAIPSAQDLQNSQDDFNFDDELAMFTNTSFLDFEMGQAADLQGTGFGAEGQAAPVEPTAESLDFNITAMDDTADFSFPDFNAFAQPPVFTESHGAQPPPIDTKQPFYSSSSSADSPTSGLTTPGQGEKRKADLISQASPGPVGSGDFEEASRMAAEEDKRRRNTAASARFRVKKKQREQALEKSAKEMSDKMNALEGRINQLETENKWLKNLITEKNDNKEDIAELWKKFSRETAERKGSERKDGVGTKIKA